LHLGCIPFCRDVNFLTPMNGHTDFLFTFHKAGANTATVYAGSIPVATLSFNVTNADLDIRLSVLNGPVATPAGAAAVYTFIPYDAFNNLAVYAPEGGNALVKYASEFRTFSLSQNGTWPFNDTVLAFNSSAFNLITTPTVAGMYLVKLQYGVTKYGYTPELLFGPIIVEALALDAASSFLLVRP
jgi:hypothetical protein